MKPGLKLWWHDLQDDCPLTLEPLAELPYPPFGITEQKHTHYFDGNVLGLYLVGRGVFKNPLSRQDLSRSDCARLDAYLAQNKLKQSRVLEAYDLAHKVVAQGQAQNDRQAKLRLEAALVLHSLFNFSGRSGTPQDDKGNSTGGGSSSAGGSGNGGKRYTYSKSRQRRGAGAIIDDDQLVSPGEANFDLFADFPELPSASEEADGAASAIWPMKKRSDDGDGNGNGSDGDDNDDSDATAGGESEKKEVAATPGRSFVQVLKRVPVDRQSKPAKEQRPLTSSDKKSIQNSRQEEWGKKNSIEKKEKRKREKALRWRKREELLRKEKAAKRARKKAMTTPSAEIQESKPHQKRGTDPPRFSVMGVLPVMMIAVLLFAYFLPTLVG